jgi:hypothetical protein
MRIASGCLLRLARRPQPPHRLWVGIAVKADSSAADQLNLDRRGPAVPRSSVPTAQSQRPTGPGSVICTGAKIGMEEDARRDLVPASDHANRCAELRCLVDDPLLLRLAEPAAPGRAGGRTRHR